MFALGSEKRPGQQQRFSRQARRYSSIFQNFTLTELYRHFSSHGVLSTLLFFSVIFFNHCVHQLCPDQGFQGTGGYTDYCIGKRHGYRLPVYHRANRRTKTFTCLLLLYAYSYSYSSLDQISCSDTQKKSVMKEAEKTSLVSVY